MFVAGVLVARLLVSRAFMAPAFSIASFQSSGILRIPVAAVGYTTVPGDNPMRPGPTDTEGHRSEHARMEEPA